MSDKDLREKAASAIALLEKFPTPAWLLAADGTIVFMNDEMKDHFGDLTGRSSEILFTENELKPCANEEKAGCHEIVLADVAYKHIRGSVEIEGGEVFHAELFEDISKEKSISLQNESSLARLKADLAIAEKIQRSLLPPNGVYGETLRFTSLYRSAEEVGGDFLDIFRVSRDEVVFYIADVSGHGIQASLLTIFLRERIRAAVTVAHRADEILSFLLESYKELGTDSTIYMTVLLCRYNRKSRELGVSNAGYANFPLILKKGGRIEVVPGRGLPISAIGEKDSYEEETIILDTGDRLILYTDGIVEEYDSARGSSMGADGLRRIAEENSAADPLTLASLIMDESSKYASGGAKDDRTVAVIDVEG